MHSATSRLYSDPKSCPLKAEYRRPPDEAGWTPLSMAGVSIGRECGVLGFRPQGIPPKVANLDDPAQPGQAGWCLLLLLLLLNETEELVRLLKGFERAPEDLRLELELRQPLCDLCFHTLLPA